jgi:hypothetical protein
MRPEKISLMCFFASYVLAMLLDATRLVRSSALNRWGAWLAAAAGFVAQTTYLIVRSRAVDLPPLLGSTHDWLLVLAWLGVLVYLLLAVVNRDVPVGLFLLPIIIVLVGSSRFVSHEPNPDLTAQKDAIHWWGMAHATFLVLGIGGVIFSAGVSLMYLAQHSRLRHRQGEPPGMRLFSLERLRWLNWWSVVLSAPLLTLGMATGVLLTWLSKSAEQPVSLFRWTFLVATVAWLGLVLLFGWLLTARHQTGKIVAMRTLLAGGFLLATMLTLNFATGGIHGVKQGAAPGTSRVSIFSGPLMKRIAAVP